MVTKIIIDYKLFIYNENKNKNERPYIKGAWMKEWRITNVVIQRLLIKDYKQTFLQLYWADENYYNENKDYTNIT